MRGSVIKRLLIIVPVAVLGLTLVSLFMPAQRVSIEGVGKLSFETTVTLSVGSEVAYANPDTERQSPYAILELTNLSPNDVTYIQDDPDAPDGNWLVYGANNAATVVRVSFPTPSGNPTVGAGLQEFKIWVRKAPSTATGTPKVRIELYENGSSLNTPLADTNVTNTTGALYSGFWNANLLSNADGSGVEARIYGTAVSGAPGARCTVDVGEVEWNVDYSVAPSITVDPTTYNFGTVTESATPSTTTTWFTITNNSSMQTDQTISVTTNTWNGGVPWTHSDTASPGPDTAGLLANRGGTWGTGDIIIKNASPLHIYENCPANTGYSFGLKLLAPTSFSDGVQKQIIVRITAVAG